LAGASLQTPLGELTALLRPPSWILGTLLLREGDIRREGKGDREGKAGEAKKGRGG